MNCFYHPEKPAVAQCSNCGKGLCKSCIITQRPIRCDACVKKIELSAKCAKENEEKNRKKQLRISLIIFMICMVISWGMYITGEFDSAPLLAFLPASVLSSFVIAGIPFGWSLISRMGRSGGGGTIFIASVETWMAIDAFRYMFKFIVSLAIGWIFLIKEMMQCLIRKKNIK